MFYFVGFAYAVNMNGDSMVDWTVEGSIGMQWEIKLFYNIYIYKYIKLSK